MVAANLKAETISLMDQRASVEAQMNSIIARLCQPGGPGITGNLLDSEARRPPARPSPFPPSFLYLDAPSPEIFDPCFVADGSMSQGFPRSDIDIPTVRSDRRRLAELRNDYEDITNKIDQNLQVLHSAKLVQNASAPSRDTIFSTAFHGGVPAASTSITVEDSHVGVPFAMVDEITEESPAAEDGLQLGDLIVKFGNVAIGDELLPRLASESQSNQGKPLSVTVIRQGSPMSLTVTPRPWHGRGLLGCHFRIL